MQGVLQPKEMAHQAIRAVVQGAETVIDATLGNGHDAKFLAELVGKDGLVIGFDVQQQAIENSTKRLSEAGLGQFEFHRVGHEKMATKVDSEVAAVMFNLGYLPAGDHTVITQIDTSVAAVEAATRLLRIGGVITVMCYIGHEGGEEEANAIVEFVATLRRQDWRVVKYGFLNAPNQPPFLIMIGRVH